MENKYKYRIPLIFFTALITIVYGIYENSFMFIVLWFMGLILPVVFFLKAKFKKDAKWPISLFILSYCLYSLYMYATNYIYIKDPNNDVFVALDSITFWKLANVHVANFRDYVAAVTTRYSNKFYLFNLINVSLVNISSFMEQPNLLVLKLQTVFLGSFSMPYIFLIFRKYFSAIRSYQYTKVFSLLSLVPFFSVVFLRDIHVYFFYVLAVNIVCHYDTVKGGIFKLILISIILLGLRPEHGLFSLMFIMGFVYLKIQKNIVLIFGFIIAGVVISVFLGSTVLSTLVDTTETYEGLRNRGGEDEGTTRTLAKLPVGLKQVALGVNSQVAPAVPFWKTWNKDINTLSNWRGYNLTGYFSPWRFMEGVGAILNIFIWGFVLAGIRRKDLRTQVFRRKEVLYLFLIAILFLLLATADINVRRIFCVYPILYLVGVLFYASFSNRLRKVTIRNTCIVVILLHILIVFIR